MKKLDFSHIAAQFQDLRNRHPGVWPPLPKILCFFSIALTAFLLIYLLFLNEKFSELEVSRNQEERLKSDFKDKSNQASGLDVLIQQKTSVLKEVERLEKNLPSKAEMDELLSDINRSGINRSMKFELFRPGQVIIRDSYAEIPVNIKVLGRYKDLGGFAIDLSTLPRIVLLKDLVIVPAPELGKNILSITATLNTFRYLDPSEKPQKKSKD